LSIHDLGCGLDAASDSLLPIFWRLSRPFMPLSRKIKPVDLADVLFRLAQTDEYIAMRVRDHNLEPVSLLRHCVFTARVFDACGQSPHRFRQNQSNR